MEKEKNILRKISTEKYIIAGIITFLIFSLGLTLGLVFKDYQSNELAKINQEQEVRYLSLQLQYLYLTSFSNYNNCPLLSAALKETITDLSNSLSKVIEYEEGKSIPSEEKLVVERRYALDNLRYWLLATQSKQKCDLRITPILYFYQEDCTDCPIQGTVLTYFKKIFGEKVLIFPINLNLKDQEPMVEIVRSQFNITTYPTLIIDSRKYTGMVETEQLRSLICSSLQDNSPECV